MSDDYTYTPAPQTFTVRDSPSYMERPITITATAHLNADHSMATKITLTRNSHFFCNKLHLTACQSPCVS